MQPATTLFFEFESPLPVHPLKRNEDVESIVRLIDVLGYGLDWGGVVGRIEAYRDDFSGVFVASGEAGIVGFLSFHAIPLFHEAAMLGRITAMAVDPKHQRGVSDLLWQGGRGFRDFGRALADGSMQW